MTKDEALKLALEALKKGDYALVNAICEELKQAQPEHSPNCALLKIPSKDCDCQDQQEPVALQMDVIVVNLVREGINKHRARELAEHFIKHTAPQPQREWVGLTVMEAVELELATNHPREFAAAIEAKLKEKNT